MCSDKKRATLIIATSDVNFLKILRSNEWDDNRVTRFAVPLLTAEGVTYIGVTDEPKVLDYEYIGDAIRELNLDAGIWDGRVEEVEDWGSCDWLITNGEGEEE